MRYQRYSRLAYLCCVILLTATLHAQESYNYDYSGETVPAPQSYILDEVLDRVFYGGIALNGPEDLFIDVSGNIYIADTGNNRIVMLDREFRLIQIFSTFSEDGIEQELSRPEGVFVSSQGDVYAADTQNRRIVVFASSGSLKEIIPEPVSENIRKEYQYLPSKIVLDKSGRLYVVGPGMYEGIMEFDQQREFSGFLGSNRVQFKIADLIWRKISSREQQAGQVQFIPEEFSNIDIDLNGFIYSVTRNEDSENPVKKHNAEGLDILKDEGFFTPRGDIDPNQTGTITGRSVFVDVAVEAGGFYHCLDAKRGRIFTYSYEGDILSIFGNRGDRRDSFKSPVAVDEYDGSLFVLDKDYSRLSVFRPTAYGQLVRSALISHETGDYDDARDLWNGALSRNANLSLAYTGLGKISLREKEYESAKDYFFLGRNKMLYSKAFRHLRRVRMREGFSLSMSVILFVFAGILVWRIFFRKEKKASIYLGPSSSFWGKISYSLYICKHPFDGMWDLKFARVGTFFSANIILLVYIILFVAKGYFTGFLFQVDNPARLNIIREIIMILFPIVLFTLANWSLTSLMGGSGSMKDIYISLTYSLIPMIIAAPILLVLSHILVLEEGSFYSALEAISWIWFLFLLFVGNKTIHEYSVTKTISMLLLTIVATGIIIFLTTLFLTFSQQVWSFLYAIFKELSFRG